MSEAKLTDIHFLVVFVFCKHSSNVVMPASERAPPSCPSSLDKTQRKIKPCA